MTTSEQLPHIFVSHSHSDNTFCLRLVRDLRHTIGKENAVWYDAEGGLKGGDYWWDKIVEEVSARDFFLVVLSPDAMRSDWVRREINIALHKRKHVIPLLLHPCNIRADLEIIHRLTFLPPRSYEDSFQELLFALGLSHFTDGKTKEEYFKEGLLHRKARRYREALISFNHALQLDPHDPFLYGRRADVYRALREYELALQDFNHAFELDPQSATAWAYATRGRVYAGMMQYQEALADLNRAFQLAPQDKWVLTWRNEVIEKLRSSSVR